MMQEILCILLFRTYACSTIVKRLFGPFHSVDQGKQNEGQVQSPGSNSGRGKGQGGGVGRRDGTGGGKGRGGGGKGGRRG